VGRIQEIALAGTSLNKGGELPGASVKFRNLQKHSGGAPNYLLDFRRLQMKKRMAGWTAAVVVLASAGSLVAHHSLSQFDTTKAVRVKGAIFRFERVNPHSILFVDQKGEDGQIQR
jgi:hypothetical protein